jgi:hypothetical protein
MARSGIPIFWMGDVGVSEEEFKPLISFEECYAVLKAAVQDNSGDTIRNSSV